MTIIFDLQGTLGGEPFGDIRNFEFYEGALEALKRLNGYRLIIMTNQSHIGKGVFTLKEYYEHEIRLRNILLNHHIPVEFYCCPHTIDDDCDCKKPKVGMYKKANDLKPIGKCFMVGDMGKSDMVFGDNIGAYKILVRTGAGPRSLTDFRNTWEHVTPDYIADNMGHVVEHILERC